MTAITDTLPEDQSVLVETLGPYDVIVDCTAADDVLFSCRKHGGLRLRCSRPSLSGTPGAACSHSACSLIIFLVPHFIETLAPWLADEAAVWSANDEVLEGAGCWSPLFPARADDVMLASAICMKELEHLVAERAAAPRFRAFEQQRTPDGISGFLLRQSPPGTQARA